jgi:transcriptional regulator with XRE-family HTH domain
MKNLQQTVTELINKEKQKLGSYSAVANKCGVSEATISQVLSGKYGADGDAMLHKIAHALGLDEEDANWNIAPIGNWNTIVKLAETARKKSMFIAISEKAGSGKTATLKDIYKQSKDGVYYLQCREWGKREFMRNLCKSLGIATPTGYASNDEVGELVFEYFAKRRSKKPLLIIDEADKLKPAALRFMIPLYNELEDKLGVLIAGTENLEKEIKRGVRFAGKGFDEIDSRFGRKFIHLIGATQVDVSNICKANGILSSDDHKAIFEECGTVTRSLENRDIKVVEDLRRLKRIIQRYQLINQ